MLRKIMPNVHRILIREVFPLPRYVHSWWSVWFLVALAGRVALIECVWVTLIFTFSFFAVYFPSFLSFCSLSASRVSFEAQWVDHWQKYVSTTLCYVVWKDLTDLDCSGISATVYDPGIPPRWAVSGEWAINFWRHWTLKHAEIFMIDELT